MLESILNSLKSEVGENIQGQTNLSSDKMDGVFSIIGEVAQKEVAGQMLSGNFKKLIPLLLLVFAIAMVSCKQGPGKIIAGTWKITDITAKGTVNDSVFREMKTELLKVEMTFQGNKYTMSSDGKIIESGTYIVDKDKLMLRTDQGMAMDATVTKDRLTLDTPDFTAVLFPK